MARPLIEIDLRQPHVQSSLHGELVEGQERALRLLHCRGGVCRAVNIGKGELEGLSADELKWLQPSPRLHAPVEGSRSSRAGRRRKKASNGSSQTWRRSAVIQKRIDRLDEAFLFEKSIDIDTYDRHKDKLCEQQTLIKIDHHATGLEKFYVEELAVGEPFCRAPRTCGSDDVRPASAPAAAVLSRGSSVRTAETRIRSNRGNGL